MNLAILIGHFPPGRFGGAELQAEAWAERLARRHRVDVITRRDPANQPERETRESYRVIRTPISPLPGLRTWLDLRAIDRAVGSLEPRPDLLLCFQTFISGLAGVRIQRRLGIPAVVWIRGELEYRLGQTMRARFVSSGVWQAARAVLVQTEGAREALANELSRRGLARVAEALEPKLFVVPNGLVLPDPPGKRGGRVLTVGRLIPEKGMDVVIDAVAGMQGLLTIVGVGPERERLAARAERHGLDVRFEGHVSRERLSELYRESACVVLAARHGEGLPNVVLEGMAHGRAIVATDVAGARDLVRHGENGLLVPPDDVAALREALARLAHERGLADRLGAAGRALAETYAWERVEPRLEAVLEAVVSNSIAARAAGGVSL
jgi:glycosyltransferase involved in cell wall biosynthesis